MSEFNSFEAGTADLIIFIFSSKMADNRDASFPLASESLKSLSTTNFIFPSSFKWLNLLPAITIGLFSAAVLNLNNMRDWQNDKASKKNTLVVKIGLPKAKKHHFSILIIGIISSIFYALKLNLTLIGLIFIIAFIPIVLHLRTVTRINDNPTEFDPELKKVAMLTFLFSVLFWISVAY